MKYRVRVNYTGFIFDDIEEASGFARTAKLHMVEKDRRESEVVIYIEDDEEEEEE